MEFTIDLDTFTSESTPEFSIIPIKGVFLGLDVSQNSTGITLYEDGVKTQANLTLETPKNVSHREVLCRRELKKYYKELFGGKHFDVILIEDAFQGKDPQVVRLLYGLNTAIDELILDGEITCDKFLRVNNKAWKSWLFRLDTRGIYKGLEDKLRIESCLSLIGITTDHSEGYQDRLDSNGLLVGYFNCKEIADRMDSDSHKKRISFSDIEYDYQEMDEMVIDSARGTSDECLNIIVIDEARWSKRKMIDYLTDFPNRMYLTKNPVKLGNLGTVLGLPYLENGGYFGFWVRGTRQKKYLGNLDYAQEEY